MLTQLELYHSIHAKGERIEDVIKAAESDKEHVDERVESKCGLAEEEQVDRGLHKDLEEGELDENETKKSALLNGESKEVIPVHVCGFKIQPNGEVRLANPLPIRFKRPLPLLSMAHQTRHPVFPSQRLCLVKVSRQASEGICLMLKCPSQGRGIEEPYDVLVLGWLLHWSLRRKTASSTPRGREGLKAHFP